MRSVMVQNKQSFFDIAIQELGSIEGAFEMALNNGFSVADNLPVNTELKVEAAPLRPEIVNFYRSKGIVPATGLTQQELQVLEAPSGIDHWAIGKDFMVQ